MTVVKYDEATRTYEGTDVPAVDSLNLDIGDGELLVLVGPSGSGKSTALRMLAGLEPLDSGTIYIGDRDVSNVRPRDRDIAMVFQNYALYPQLSVAENMGFALKQQGVPKEERTSRVRETARILDLTPYLDRKPKHLSGGQRQRVAMGRAIVRQPAVYLMDEPLSNLDAKLRVATRTEVVELQHRLGVTTVYVTHDQVEAMTMGTRIAVMDKGELQQVGTPQDLYDNPRKLFVAGFIGSPAMNCVNVTADGPTVAGEGLSVPVPTRYRAGLTGSKDLVAGFRPEHLDLGEIPNTATIRAKADVVEFLGDEELLHLTVTGHEGDVVAVVSSEHRVKPGDIVDLKLPLEKLHLFDRGTGDSLAWSTAAAAA
jgi:multiple sugar transport system ATP-binding protein